jgi:hypothetical protein
MASEALHRLIYMSTAVGVLRADELDRIVIRSRAANTGAGITGLLLFHEGSFLQLLEGPAAALASLLLRIRGDRRHSGLITLRAGPCAARVFPDSPLHYVAPRNLTRGERQAFSDLRDAVRARPQMVGPPAPGADNGLSEFMSSFASARAA